MTETEMVLKGEKRISMLAVKERTLARRLVHRNVAMANWKGRRETGKSVLRRLAHGKRAETRAALLRQLRRLFKYMRARLFDWSFWVIGLEEAKKIEGPSQNCIVALRRVHCVRIAIVVVRHPQHPLGDSLYGSFRYGNLDNSHTKS